MKWRARAKKGGMGTERASNRERRRCRVSRKK